MAGFPGQCASHPRVAAGWPHLAEGDFRLASGRGQGQRPGPEGAAGLHEFGHGHVQDALTAGLGAADAGEQALDERGALAGGTWELVAIAICYSPP